MSIELKEYQKINDKIYYISYYKELYIKDIKKGNLEKAFDRDIFKLLDYNLSFRKKEELENYKISLIKEYLQNFDINHIENLFFLKKNKHKFMNLYNNFEVFEKLSAKNLSLDKIIYIINYYSFKEIERNLNSKIFIEELFFKLGSILKKELNLLNKIIIKEKEYEDKIYNLKQKFEKLNNEENIKNNFIYIFEIFKKENNDYETFYQLNNLYNLNIIKNNIYKYIENFLKNDTEYNLK